MSAIITTRRLVMAGSIVAGMAAFGAAPALHAQARGQGGSAPAAAGRGAASTDIRVLKVRENVYMLSGAGGNITLMTFPEGALLVDTGNAQMANAVLDTVKRLSPKPIAHIINTNASDDHVGGNAVLAASGRRIPLEVVAGEGPMIVAHENVMTRMSAPTGKEAAAPERAWPNETYHLDEMKLSTRFHGGEPIQLIHIPAAHSDGDSIVWFRRADVIATGDIFMTTTYPIIDVAHGGTIDGVIAGLNKVLELAFPDFRSEGGTMIVPGHGRLTDMAEVAYYRDMVTIIRDRVQDAIKKGQTVEQVKAAKLTRDYDARFGATTGPWTTDMFVDAVYKTLSAKKK
jgi:glyoxylase-like metal-dependent hydrolase (beta-lactamase superfamily II)